jgi:hypothetical protein
LQSISCCPAAGDTTSANAQRGSNDGGRISTGTDIAMTFDEKSSRRRVLASMFNIKHSIEEPSTFMPKGEPGSMGDQMRWFEDRGRLVFVDRGRMSFSTVVNTWQVTLMLAAWVYGLCAMSFVWMTKRDLLAKSSRELFYEFPDLAVAIATIMVTLLQLGALVITDSLIWLANA